MSVLTALRDKAKILEVTITSGLDAAKPELNALRQKVSQAEEQIKDLVQYIEHEVEKEASSVEGEAKADVKTDTEAAPGAGVNTSSDLNG